MDVYNTYSAEVGKDVPVNKGLMEFKGKEGGERVGGRGQQLHKLSLGVGVSDLGLDIPMLPQARRFPSESEWRHHPLREVAVPDHQALLDEKAKVRAKPPPPTKV